MRRLKAGLAGLLMGCGMWLPLAGQAASAEPSAQALAEHDAGFINGMMGWMERSMRLPDDIELDPALRDALSQIYRDHLARVRQRIPAWIAEERAEGKAPSLRGPELTGALSARMINEMAVSSIESVGRDHDEAWLKAALAPNACFYVHDWVFARRVDMMQAAPAEARPALLAAERELLSRWGTPRQGLAPRPPAAELMAAEHAVARVRGGLPVAALPMKPYLAGMVFGLDRKPGKPDRWEQCLRSQWWLQSQLADGKTDRAQALTVYRYSMLLNIDDFLPQSYKPKPGYPRAATYFSLQGATTVRATVDEQGKAVKAEVVAREIRVPGIRNVRPVAFETLFDEGAVEQALRRSFAAGKAGDVEFAVDWKLGEARNDAK